MASASIAIANANLLRFHAPASLIAGECFVFVLSFVGWQFVRFALAVTPLQFPKKLFPLGLGHCGAAVALGRRRHFGEMHD